jgi:multiple sugar transport system substrate-binding protein
MRARLRSLALVALAGAALAALTGFASGVSPASTTKASGKVTLNYFTFSAAPDHLKDLQNIINGFEKKYPNIHVNVQTASYNDYFTKLQTQIASGQAPDTFELNYENFVTYASAGKLLNLSRVAKTDRFFNSKVYYPRAYQVFQLKGTQYGLPESFSVVLLFYNKDIFKQAGVALPKTTWKWSDELAAAKRLTIGSKGIFGDFQPVQFFEFYKVLAQNGGTFLNASKTNATFDSAQGIGALNWLLTKTSPTGVMPTKDQMGGLDDTAMFKAGKLAMWHNGIWQFSGLKDAPFDWDVIVEPGNVQKAHHFFANAAVGSAKTKHPREVWTWLRYFTSNANAVKIRVGNSWELPAVQNPRLFRSYLGQTPPANRQAVFQALDNIVTPPVIKQEQQLQDIVGKYLDKAVAGQLSAGDALHQAAAEVNALLKTE